MSQLLYESSISISIFLFILLQSGLAIKRPNIVLILADDLGFNDVGYHNTEIISPVMDKLAVEGVILENYYVQPVCTPSRSQLLTGRYQIHTGLQHDVIYAVQKGCLPLDELTLAEKLKEVGYVTHIVGKWHLGFSKKECLPTSRGFDTHYGMYAGKSDYFTKQTCGYFGGWKYSQEFCGYDFHNNTEVDWSANGTYSTHLYGMQAMKVIMEHDKKKPMFLYLPFQAVHGPLQAPEYYIKLYSHIKSRKRRVYAAMVTAMDDAIEMVVNALKHRNMMKDTLIIFSTDNGGSTRLGGSNFPLRGQKNTLWEGGIRGIGFVHGFGIKEPGRISHELFHISDWFPTLTYIAGALTNGTKPLDGQNIWWAISNSSVPSPRTEILHNIDPYYSTSPKLQQYHNRHEIDTTKGQAALRVGKWKLLTGYPGQSTGPTSVRLFNIRADPVESTDLAMQYPGIVDSMLSRLAYYNATAAPVLWERPDKKSNPALRGGVWNPWSD